MKMTKEDFNSLKLYIDTFLDDDPGILIDYEEGRFARADKVKDLNKRFRWDLYHRIISWDFRSRLYNYLDDTHIDTALRRIVPTITRNY